MKYDCVGVDISKEKFDVYYQGKSWVVKQSPEAIKKDFIKVIKKIAKTLKNVLVVCEASGGYERLLTNILSKEKIQFHVAHAQFIKAFAQSYGLKAKTDKIDAKNIAKYAQERQVTPDNVLTENKLKIGDLLKRREQLINDKIREEKRLDKHQDEAVDASVRKHVQWLKDEIKAIGKALDELAKSDKDIKQEMKILMSVPGIGKIIALHIIAFLPEVGQLSHKQLTALVGFAPYNHDSGKYEGRRSIRGGRSRIRRLFYLSALVNKTHNPELKEFYARLIKKGKPVKVALVATAHKTLCMLNSVMARRTPWVKHEQLAY